MPMEEKNRELDQKEIKYNSDQLEAIKSTEGPLLIIAGPGTGKTATLIARVEHIIASGLARPGQITMTTFTNKAEEEIRARLAQNPLIQEIAARSTQGLPEEVRVGNFHKLSLDLIEGHREEAGLAPGYRVVSGTEVGSLVERYWYALTGFSKSGLYGRGENDGGRAQRLRHAMTTLFPGIRQEDLAGKSYWKKEYIRLMDRIREGFSDFNGAKNPEESEAVEAAKLLLKRYRDMMAYQNILDYSEILCRALDLLNNREILKEEQDKALYFMVDEYQDTNPIQEQIIGKISSGSGNICVVGDDDQSLYRFRGASVENLLNFEKRYPGAKLIKLETNYRSGREIVRLASEYMNAPYGDKRDREIEERRYKKNLRSGTDLTTGAVYSILEDDPEAWAGRIIELIRQVHCQGRPYRDIAVLANSVRAYNPAISFLKRSLKKEGIPFISDKTSSIMASDIVEKFQAMAFVLFFYGYDPAKLSEKVVNIIAGIKPDDREELVIKREEIMAEFEERGSMSLTEAFQRFFSLEAFKKVLSEPDLEDERQGLAIFLAMVQKLQEGRLDRGGKLVTDLTPGNLLTRGREFYADLNTIDEWGLDNREADQDAYNDGVRIMSIHASKGLEFPVVILEEARTMYVYKRDPRGVDLLPRSALLGQEIPQKLENDLDRLRQYYTAMTRAQDILILTATSLSPGKWERPIDSSFVRLNKKLEDLDLEGALKALRPAQAQAKTQIKNYSYTRDLALYRACPLSYYFTRYLGMPSETSPQEIWGSIIHEVLCQINRAGVEVSCLGEVRKLIDRTLEGYGARLKDEDEQSVRAQIDKILIYIEREKDRLIKNSKKAELGLNAFMDTYMFNGNLDLLTMDDGIVDFKSSLSAGALSSDTYINQLKSYRILFNKSMGKDPYDPSRLNALYDLSAQRGEEALKRFDFTREDLVNWREVMDRSVSGIEEGIFEKPEKRIGMCGSCPMRFYCWG